MFHIRVLIQKIFKKLMFLKINYEYYNYALKKFQNKYNYKHI